VIPDNKLLFGVENLHDKARRWIASKGEKTDRKNKAYYMDIKRGSEGYPEYMD
jgi:hypothetical protein